MESKTLLLAVTIAAVAIMPGCNSQRPRFASWTPSSMWGSKDEAETSALARSAPKLPSSKFEPMEPSSTSVAANSQPTTSPASRDRLASAPTAQYPAAASNDYVSPASKTTEGTPAPTTALASSTPTAAAGPASTIAPQTSPYSNDNYVSPTNASSSLASGSSTAPPQDRYAPVDRYAAPPAATELPPIASAPAFTPPAAAPAGPPVDSSPVTTNPISSIDPTTPIEGVDRNDRYDRYANTPAASASPTVAVPPAESVAQVTLPAAPGGYRPGGTSTYSSTSTANIATRPANAESATSYPVPPYEEPAAPSSYGTPDRYR